MNKRNCVFIAKSIDGFISDKNGKIDWLHSIPNPTNNDMGYGDFISNMNAIIMGRNTFETVCSFDIEWPYQIPVFVLSTSLKKVPNHLNDKVFIVDGALHLVLERIHALGHQQLYIDGGTVIQSFLKEDLIDEMILTTIPILLGGGTPLFSHLNASLNFKCIGTKIFLESVVQNHFIRRTSQDKII